MGHHGCVLERCVLLVSSSPMSQRWLGFVVPLLGLVASPACSPREPEGSGATEARGGLGTLHKAARWRSRRGRTVPEQTQLMARGTPRRVLDSSSTSLSPRADPANQL